MLYTIEHETQHRIRISLHQGPITPAQENILCFALGSIKSVRSVKVYRSTSGLAITFDEGRDTILEKLSKFNYENVTMLAREEPIDLEEMRLRKLNPAVKQRIRARLLFETVADMVLPVPLQLGYHAYQMITLRDI